MEKKKLLNGKTILSVVIAMATVYGVKAWLNKAPETKSQFEYAAEAVNKQCPMMIDSDTRINNAVTSGKEFKYFYTLVNTEAKDFNKEVFDQTLKPSLVNNIKTHPDLKIYRDHKMIMQYNYADKNGVHLSQIDVTPSDYLE